MLRELLATFDVDTAKAAAKVKDLDGKIEGAKNMLGALASAFIGSALVHGLKEFVGHQIEAGSRINDLSEKLGVGTDELQQFQFAAGLTGVASESAAKGLQFLNKNMGEALDGNKEAVETFKKLDVALKGADGQVRELGDVIPEIADAFEKMGSDQERTATAMKVFGKAGADLLPLLKGGAKGVAEFNAEFERLGGGMRKDFIEAADKAGDEIDKLKFALNGWKSQLVFAILPALTRGVTHLQTWVGGLRKVTNETRLAQYVMAAFGVGAAAAGFKAASGFAEMMGILPKDASFWKKILGLGEIALVVAGVALLALAFEDLFTFVTGGQSLIGDLVNEFLGMHEAQQITDQLAATWEYLNGIFAQDFRELKPIADIMWSLGKEIVPYAVASFLDLLRVVVGLVTAAATLVKILGQISQLDFSGAGKTLEAAGKTLFGEKGLLSTSSVGNLAIKTAAKANAPVDVTETVRTGRYGAAGDTTVNVENNVTNKITGVKDAAGAGEAAKSGTKDALGSVLADALGAVGTGG